MKRDELPETNPIVREDLARIAAASLPWEQLDNKTVMVTGGGGFLAAYLIKGLLAAGTLHKLNIRVVCMARGLRSVKARLGPYLGSPELTLFQHDVAQPVPANCPHADLIVHSASLASPKFYSVDPVGTLIANSAGTTHMLELAVAQQSERFLFFSSGEVYGVPLRPVEPVREQDYGYLDPMQVRSCYAESKRMGETMCVSWAQQFGLHASVVRPFHTYGPGMALDDGRVFADFVADVLASRDIVLKSDGSGMRPFCYLADATIGFLTVLLKGGKAQAYNVGNPDAEATIRELANTIAGLFPERGIGTRIEIPPASAPYMKSPIDRSCPSIAKVKALGWTPTTGIAEGFRRTILSFQ